MKWSINTYFKNVLFKPRSENTHGLIGWMNWSLCNPLQAKLYLSVIDDVIESMRELFVEEGFEDRVLDDLRHVSLNCCPILWKQKKTKNRAQQNFAECVKTKVKCAGLVRKCVLERKAESSVSCAAALGVKDDAV